MIMRVTWGKIRPGNWDKYEALWNANLATTKNKKGIKGRLLLRDTANRDAGYSMTLWETEAEFEAYSQHTEKNAEMAECFVGQYVTTVCEVCGMDFSKLPS